MKKAIVLGGTQDHIGLVQILKDEGFYVILIDYLDSPPAKIYADQFVQESILDKDKVLTIASKHKASLVIATCIDQALETSAYVSEKLGLPCHISYDTALSLTNKRYMKKQMMEHKIPTSDFFILNDVSEIEITDKLKYPLVIKPVDANSSKGVFKIEKEDDIQKFFHISKSFSKTGEVIVEEFVEGKELSVDVFIYKGESTVLMITENVKLKANQQSFTISESYYNRILESNIKKDIERIANQITQAYRILNGPLLIQCIYNEELNRISVIEFSSRIGGGSKHLYINTITGFDILQSFVNIIIGNAFDGYNISHKYELAKIRYLYTHPGVISKYINFEELKESGDILEYFIYKTCGSKVEEAIKSTDRCAGYFFVSTNKDDFAVREEAIMNTVRVLNEVGNDIILR